MPEEPNEDTQHKREAAKPVFQKKRGTLTGEARKRLLAKKQRQRDLQRAGHDKLKPVQAAFLAEVCMNGGNPRSAAVKLGLDPATGTRWMRKPAVREAFERYRAATGELMQDWALGVRRAQDTLLDLLDSTSDMVRVVAAKEILDRGLGKVASKVEAVVTHRDTLTEVEMQAALSLVAGRGMALADAARYVREHPDEVAAWAESQARLAAAEPAEVLEVGSTRTHLPA